MLPLQETELLLTDLQEALGISEHERLGGLCVMVPCSRAAREGCQDR